MSRRTGVFAPFALASAVILGLSGCSVLEDWGVLNSADSATEESASTEETPATETESSSETTAEETEEEVVDEGLAVADLRDHVFGRSLYHPARGTSHQRRRHQRG